MNILIETPFATFRIISKNPLHPLLKSVLGFTFHNYSVGSISYSPFPESHENDVYISCDWRIIDANNQTVLLNKDLANTLRLATDNSANKVIKHRIGNIGLQIHKSSTLIRIPTSKYDVDYTLNKSAIQSHQYNDFHYDSITLWNPNPKGVYVKVNTDDIENTIELKLPKQYKIKGLESLGTQRHTKWLQNNTTISYNLDNKLELLKYVKLTLNPEVDTPDQEISLFDIVTYYPNRCQLYIETPQYKLDLFVKALHKIDLTYQLKP